jgi:hypothetical protein
MVLRTEHPPPDVPAGDRVPDAAEPSGQLLVAARTAAEQQA